MQTPLQGIRVLDFSHALAGPYCTMLLAQYGADVFKVEGPDTGDMGRGWGPPFTGGEASYFLALNPGKRGICLDLKTPEGLATCLDLIEKVDVVVENLRTGTMERLGLGYEAARKRNPGLIYCSITGYGQTGPARDNPAMDLIVQASSGLMSTTGTPAGELVRSGHSVADTTAGLFGVIGILMALRVRDQTGEGQFVDVAMLDGLVSTMASSYAYACGSGNVPRPQGTAFSTIVPYRTYPTADREVAIAVGSEKLWSAFCIAIERPDLATHPDYANNALRVKNRAVLEPILMAVFRQHTSEFWERTLNAVGIPCSAVKNIQEVIASDQARVREMFPVVEHSGCGPLPVTGPPVKLSATPGRVPFGAPRKGEHTMQIIEELLGGR